MTTMKNDIDIELCEFLHEKCVDFAKRVRTDESVSRETRTFTTASEWAKWIFNRKQPLPYDDEITKFTSSDGKFKCEFPFWQCMAKYMSHCKIGGIKAKPVSEKEAEMERNMLVMPSHCISDGKRTAEIAIDFTAFAYESGIDMDNAEVALNGQVLRGNTYWSASALTDDELKKYKELLISLARTIQGDDVEPVAKNVPLRNIRGMFKCYDILSIGDDDTLLKKSTFRLCNTTGMKSVNIYREKTSKRVIIDCEGKVFVLPRPLDISEKNVGRLVVG